MLNGQLVPSLPGDARLFHCTIISGRIVRNFRSLIPRTIIKCSARRNGPCSSRYATIRSAMILPSPGSVSSNCGVAVLMLISEGRSAFGVSRSGCTYEEECRGIVAQLEASIASANMKKVIDDREDFAGGRFCFTYASKCL